MSEDVEKCKKEIEALKGEIESKRGDSDSGNTALTDAASGSSTLSLQLKSRRILKGHFGKIYALHWGPDNQRLVSASQDGKLLIWNGWTTNKLHAVPLRSSWVMTCCYSPSGHFVACGGLDNLCTLYKLPENGSQEASIQKIHAELAQHEGYLSCCRFITDGEILTSSGDATLILWDVENKHPKAIFNDHQGDVMSVSIYDKNGTFVSGSVDSTCKVWDYRSKKACIRTFTGHESDINTVSFFPDGNAVISGSDDSTIRLWDIRSYSVLNKYANDKILCGVTSVDFSSTGKFIFAGYDDYNAYVWDTKMAQLADRLQGHENRVSCLQVCKSGKALCTGSWDTLLRVWA
jgi:guanine nucleotide-binding protein G(I)/G(S)/G(T) subunit beta-1